MATAAVSLAACGPPDAPNVGSVKLAAGGPPLTNDYALSAGDQIDIRFPFYPDLNDNVTVGPDGHVALQLVKSDVPGRQQPSNDFKLAGLSVPDATRLLNERYSAVLREPQLSITVRTYSLQAIYVDGWVNSPGLIRSDIPLTVSRAIAQAGGMKLGAHSDHILLLRRDVNGTIHYYQIVLGNYAGAGAQPGQDPLLRSYDLVYVPQTTLATAADVMSTITKSVPFYVTAPLP